jgi:hypothetical protein
MGLKNYAEAYVCQISLRKSLASSPEINTLRARETTAGLRKTAEKKQLWKIKRPLYRGIKS